MAPFTESDKNALLADLEGLEKVSRKTSKVNQGYDIVFKVSVFLLSLGVTVCSAFAASDLFSDVRVISLVSAVLAAVSTAISGLSTNLFNFSTRQEVWQLRASGYSRLADRVKFTEPDEDDTLKIKGELDIVSDSSTIEEVLGIIQKIDAL